MQSVSKAHQHRRYLYGIFMASLGSVLFSGKAVLIKLSFAHHASAETLIALRMLMALPLFWGIYWWKARQHSMSRLTLLDQIKIFAEASHIISPHGAGLLNIIFSKPGTRVIEIAQKELIDKKPYPILSHIMDHKHTFLLAETISLGNNKPAGVKRLKDYNNLKIKIRDLLDLI